MDRRPPNLWFIFAYLLLVAIVAIGFYWQAQTVEDLENTQKVLRFEQVNLQQNLCDLFLTVAEEIEEPTGIDLTQEILVSFEREGIDCRVPVNP